MKSKGGRPAHVTATVVGKLEEAFLMGCTDIEACLFAGINRDVLYDYQKKNPGFADRKEQLKQNPFLLARGVQLKDLKECNSAIAQKVLERKEGSKVALTAAVQVTITGKDADL